MADIYPGSPIGGQPFFDEFNIVGLVKIRSITYNSEIQFLPYDLKITESLTPEWNQETVIGRMDPIARFKRMGRTMNINFKARAKERIDSNGQPNGPYLPYDDLLHSVDHLKRLLYPRYNNNQVMTSPPLFRIKCENLILAGEETNQNGVLCFITSLKADPVMEKNTVYYRHPGDGLRNDSPASLPKTSAGGNVPYALYPKQFDINIQFTVLNELLSKKQVTGVLNQTYFYHFETTTGPAGGHPAAGHPDETVGSNPTATQQEREANLEVIVGDGTTILRGGP
jgi:hypothetical protein